MAMVTIVGLMWHVMSRSTICLAYLHAGFFSAVPVCAFGWATDPNGKKKRDEDFTEARSLRTRYKELIADSPEISKMTWSQIGQMLKEVREVAKFIDWGLPTMRVWDISP